MSRFPQTWVGEILGNYSIINKNKDDHGIVWWLMEHRRIGESGEIRITENKGDQHCSQF